MQIFPSFKALRESPDTTTLEDRTRWYIDKNGEITCIDYYYMCGEGRKLYELETAKQRKKNSHSESTSDSYESHKHCGYREKDYTDEEWRALCKKWSSVCYPYSYLKAHEAEILPQYRNVCFGATCPNHKKDR